MLGGMLENLVELESEVEVLRKQVRESRDEALTLKRRLATAEMEVARLQGFLVASEMQLTAAYAGRDEPAILSQIREAIKQ